jgi:hypothetical protein
MGMKNRSDHPEGGTLALKKFKKMAVKHKRIHITHARTNS